MPLRSNKVSDVAARQEAKAKSQQLVPALGEHNKSLEMTAR
jgi:hypothetical protein